MLGARPILFPAAYILLQRSMISTIDTTKNIKSRSVALPDTVNQPKTVENIQNNSQRNIEKYNI